MLLLTLALLAAEPTVDPRALASDATYAQLVAGARTLTTTAPSASAAGCVLRPTKSGARLEATLDTHGLPLGDAPPDLDAALGAPVELALATRYGLSGSERASLVLQPLSPTSRALGNGIIPVLLVTDQGTSFSVIAPAGSFSPGARAEKLTASMRKKFQQMVLPRAGGVVVTAEASVPVATLVRELAVLKGFKGEVVLASVLPSDAPALRKAERRVDAPDICRTGFGDIPPGETFGELPMAKLTSVIEDLQQRVDDKCTAKLASDGGGTLKVSMRIGKAGDVRDACIERTDADDAALRKCVVDVVKSAKLPKLTSGTFTNFGTEVSARPRGLAQAALCK